MKITFEEANSRLVAFTKSFEDTSRGNVAHKEGKTKHVLSFLNIWISVKYFVTDFKTFSAMFL